MNYINLIAVATKVILAALAARGWEASAWLTEAARDGAVETVVRVWQGIENGTLTVGDDGGRAIVVKYASNEARNLSRKLSHRTVAGGDTGYDEMIVSHYADPLSVLIVQDELKKLKSNPALAVPVLKGLGWRREEAETELGMNITNSRWAG